ncbi:MAG: hypothetical protein EBX40_01115 [Gammaproteobacteria bacterium]|nr:hypothetical protein [Gammaproteobacteria bacterium]
MNFETAVSIILDHEGGYVNDPKDRGGETRYGISKRAYPDLDIKNLSKADAIAIYRKDYWDKIKADTLPGWLRLMAFDCAVNQGVGACQSILKAIKVDDGPASVLASFADFRLVRYARNPTFDRFALGWTRRLVDVLVRSLV